MLHVDILSSTALALCICAQEQMNVIILKTNKE
jgi:hypothetical protein